MMSFSPNKNITNIDTDFSNQLIIIVKEEKMAFLGYLVIDTLVDDKCSGGIRMAHDISLNELAHLARTMTLKFQYNNIALGGAKAGIVCPFAATDKQRKQILESFAHKLGPIIRTIYYPGGDLGVGPKELDIIFKAAEIKIEKASAHYKAGFFTAYGVFVSAKTLIKQLGLNVVNCTFAIEGYGNVGKPLAKLIYQAGSKILAISTIDGAIYNKRGLDIHRLHALTKEHGDKAVNFYNDAKKIKKSDLFKLDADVIIPGARAWTINIDNVHEIRAKAIVPAANIPVTREASEILYKKKIASIPDFVSTGGGIIGPSLLRDGFEEQDILNIMHKTFESKVSKLIQLSHQKHTSLDNLAAEIAGDNLKRVKNNLELQNSKVKWFLTRMKEEKSLVPICEGIAARLYTKFSASPFFIIKKILKPLAVSWAYKRWPSDVKYYRELSGGD